MNARVFLILAIALCHNNRVDGATLQEQIDAAARGDIRFASKRACTQARS